ncbi:hypothetical protein H5407_17360 [Mitsuaria sp. WAJ17]|uniref:hypothetical protein n=1 Tax=Mitsuaria sp. WAJ17 TaxID=2761452 RepID=UPI001603A546|nr:hypothetical protein [Mitsuaria sp. WAJ17]MBB2487000.1 hypothetical protein [Mitsuaria sp. WAJ17]
MKQKRLVVLLAVMVGLLGLRAWSWLHADDMAHPVVRSTPQPAGLRPLADAASSVDLPAGAQDAAAGTRDPDTAEPGNAFASRLQVVLQQPVTPPAPKPATPATATSAVTAPVGQPLAEPAAVRPPMSAIGTWQDELGLSVFIAIPQGVRQGRVGDVLLAEYRIASITPQQVRVVHLPSNKEMMLPISAAR